MKLLKNFGNADKLKVLHELFPEEIPQILENIQVFCADFKERKEEYEKNWDSGLMPFNYWQSLSEDTAGLIQQYGSNMVKSSRVFSDQLSYGYAVLFVNDRIVKYALDVSTNEKFKLAIALLFNPKN